MHALNRWDGFVVCPDDFEIRHPLDKVRPRMSRTYPVGPLRPPGANQFIDNNDPFTSETMIDGTHDIFDNLPTQRVIDENTIPGRDPPTVTMVTFPTTSDLNNDNHSWLFQFRQADSNKGRTFWFRQTGPVTTNDFTEADAEQPSAVGLNLMDSTSSTQCFRSRFNAAGKVWVASYSNVADDKLYYGTVGRNSVGTALTNVADVTTEFDAKTSPASVEPDVGWWITKPKFDGSMTAYTAQLTGAASPATFDVFTKSIAADGTIGAETTTGITLSTTHENPPAVSIMPTANDGIWLGGGAGWQNFDCYNPILPLLGEFTGAGHTVRGFLIRDTVTGKEFPFEDEDDTSTAQAVSAANMSGMGVAKDADSGTVYCALALIDAYAGHSVQDECVVRVDTSGNYQRIWHLDIDGDSGDKVFGFGCDEWGIYILLWPQNPATRELKFRWYTWDGTLKLSWTSDTDDPELWSVIAWETVSVTSPYTILGHVIDGLTELREDLS